MSCVMHPVHNDGLRVRSKVWLEVDGEPVFGRGRMFLLRAVERHGSINRAARELDISYRKAWGYVKAMEDRLGVSLLVRRKGGKHGGGASLTPEARELIGKYVELEDGIRENVDARFGEIFGGRDVRP